MKINTELIMKVLILNEFMHKKNREAISLMCASVGAEVTLSSEPSVFSEAYDLVLVTNRLIPSHMFPRAKKIIYGPHNFVFPEAEWQRNTSLFDERCTYTCLSPWVKQVWEEFGSLALPVVPLPFAVNVDLFHPTHEPKEYDCLVYFKHRHQSLLPSILEELQRRNLKFAFFRYGTYQQEDYLNALQKSKFGIWLGSHESQGFALEEALSCNLPLLVLNATSMFDEYDDNNRLCYTNEVGKYKLRATSIPYWDERCGIVSSVEKFQEDLPRMLDTYGSFHPRDYIMEALSPEVCMRRMLS